MKTPALSRPANAPTNLTRLHKYDKFFAYYFSRFIFPLLKKTPTTMKLRVPMPDLEPVSENVAPDERTQKERTQHAPWTFLTNHSHVLLCLAKDPTQTLRNVAASVGITERAVQRIVGDLESAGILERTREGRRNSYRVRREEPLRHDLEAHKTIGDLLEMVWGEQFRT